MHRANAKLLLLIGVALTLVVLLPASAQANYRIRQVANPSRSDDSLKSTIYYYTSNGWFQCTSIHDVHSIAYSVAARHQVYDLDSGTMATDWTWNVTSGSTHDITELVVPTNSRYRIKVYGEYSSWIHM